MYEQILSLVTSFFKSMKGSLMFSFLLSRWNGKRGPRSRLRLEQIVALNIYRFHFRIGDLKNYHKMVKELTNYENFLKATNKPALFILSFMNSLMRLNRMNGSKIHYMDSTPITVCMNHKIYPHKVTKNHARRSKSTKGWRYGFKMSGICNEKASWKTSSFHMRMLPTARLPKNSVNVLKERFCRCRLSAEERDSEAHGK